MYKFINIFFFNYLLNSFIILILSFIKFQFKYHHYYYNVYYHLHKK